jgi:hypothetical protein
MIIVGTELNQCPGFHTEKNMEKLFKEGIDAYVADGTDQNRGIYLYKQIE